MRPRAVAILAVPAMVAALSGCAGSSSAGYAADPPPPSYPGSAAPKAQSAEDYGVQQQSKKAPLQQATAAAPPTAPNSAPAAPAATAAFDGLKPGAKGPEVRALQEKLQSLGFWIGSVDGSYGLTTSQAVMAVQKAAGLSKDGVMGPQTRQALASGVSVSPKSSRGRVVEIDKSRQLVMLVQNGNVQTILNTSTGSGQQYSSEGRTSVANTPAGHFTMTRQVDKLDKGPLGDLWRPKYFNGGIALHGAADVPSYPASHGCARVSNPAMNWIWDTGQAPIGTPVLVY